MGDIQAELQEYIDQHDIHKLFASLVESLLVERPANPVQFVVDYLSTKYPDKVNAAVVPAGRAGAAAAAGDAADSASSSGSDEEGDGDAKEADVQEAPKRGAARGARRRIAVSAEAGVDPAAMRETWEKQKKVYPKSDAEKERIRRILAANLMFTNLDEEQTNILVDAMFPVEKDDGEVIIQAGDAGDLFYVVDAGTPQVFVTDAETGQQKMVLEYREGGSFGELALMYNAPRAATVKAKGIVKLWALDRLTFKVILLDTTMRKREAHKAFLEKVPILASLMEYERLTVADALKEEIFPENTTIITQGEVGDKFYIIEKGEVACTQRGVGGGPDVEVMRLSRGQYFGEIALLTNQPRKATVRTLTKTKCLTLDRPTFMRVMGPLTDILKRNMEQYNSIMALNI